jgi:preprotein translocase subunit YajC
MAFSSLFSMIWLFAEAEGGAAPAANGGGGPAGLGPILPSMVAIFFLFYLLILRPERRKQAEHKSLLEAVKKNDRIVTIGGIYGVVTNVQRDSDRVTIKIDEANNTKVDVTFSAIAKVIVDEQKTPEDK